ncbi:MAG TPA: hypothetical protein VK348_08325 [Planctomycetota bacterium]|nr:hypothetical protein [Planctomycetota bacterium]
MQQRRIELNRLVLAIGRDFTVAAVVVLLVAWPRRQLVPTLDECRVGAGAFAAVVTWWWWAALLAGAVCAVTTAARAPAALAGWFARTAAAVLAAGSTAALGLYIGDGGLVPAALPALALGAGVVAGTLAGRSAPRLTERGPWSLALSTLVVALPAVLARRQQEAAAAAALPVAAVQAAAPRHGSVALMLPAGVPAIEVCGLLAALRRPFFGADLDVFVVREDGSEARWLQRMGMPTLRLLGATAVLQPGAPPGQVLPTPMQVPAAGIEVAAGGRPTTLWVRAGESAGGAIAVAFTPAGTFTLQLDDHGYALLAGSERARFQALLAPLPPALRIRVLVVSPGSADAYGWADIATP